MEYTDVMANSDKWNNNFDFMNIFLGSDHWSSTKPSNQISQTYVYSNCYKSEREDICSMEKKFELIIIYLIIYLIMVLKETREKNNTEEFERFISNRKFNEG